VPFFASNFKMARPYFNRLLKRPKRAPVNKKANKKLEEVNAQLQAKNTKYYYLNNWVINALTKQIVT
jgi:biotin synthase-related radical SAM superfamily protein